MEDASAGEQVTKSLWPRRYAALGITNLYRFELPGAKRACYTIQYVDGTLGNCSFVLDILTHREYEKLFGYR